MNSRTSLYGALQDSIVDAELLLNAMEPLEFAAHSHLIAATELKETVLLCHPNDSCFLSHTLHMTFMTHCETIKG